MGGSITRAPELSPTPPFPSSTRGSLRIESVDVNEGDLNKSNTQSQNCESNAANISNEEASRRKKLGILLVQLGIAKEDKIFGSLNSEVMNEFRQGRMSDILNIPTPREDGAHSRGWFNPWRWFSSLALPRIRSPPDAALVSYNTAQSGDKNGKEEEKKEEEELDSDKEVNDALWQREEGPASVALWPTQTPREAAPSSEGRRKRSTLPPIIFSILTDDEVDSLTPSVRKDREILLQEEAHIHKLLQSIEDTRYRYLVHSNEMVCNPEVLAVVKCYEEKNASARKKREAMQKQLEKNSMRGLNKKTEEGNEEKAPIVVFDALECEKVVERLKLCTERIVKAYSAREL